MFCVFYMMQLTSNGLSRHLTNLCPFKTDDDIQHFRSVLSQLPSVTSVTLDSSMGHIPWAVLHSCLIHPRMVSLSLTLHEHGLESVPCSRNDLATMAINLKSFAYTTTMWREWEGKGKNLLKNYTRELRFLSALVPFLNKTATSLTLPVESCPILQMAAVQWPQLKELTLTGRFVVAAQAVSLQLLLRSTPALHVFCVQAARSSRVGRRPLIPPASGNILSAARHPVPHGSTQPQSPSLSLLPELRSLTIAFPDPQDGIFSIDTQHLTHLSLRDCPRNYHRFGYQRIHVVPKDWCFPNLSPTECLTILKRLIMPNLQSLELVYEAPTAGSDDELLTYVAEAYPRLSHLEIHRYRKARVEHVQHVGVAPPIRDQTLT